MAKTTTALNFAVVLRKKGFRVLLVDMDPQRSLSKGVASTDDITPPYTVADLIYDEDGTVDVRDAIIHTKSFDLIPGSIALAKFEKEMQDTPAKEFRLTNALKPLYDDYAFIIIDNQPGKSPLTISSLTASTDVIIPVMPDKDSMDQALELAMTIRKVKKYTNPDLRVRGLLFTRINPQTVLIRVLKELGTKYARELDTKVFDTNIRSTIAVGEANFSQEDLFSYDPNSTAAQDYIAFADEYLAETEDK